MRSTKDNVQSTNQEVRRRVPQILPKTAAQAAGPELWRHLITHPEGELLIETAFEGYVSDPLISWHFHATLNSAAPPKN